MYPNPNNQYSWLTPQERREKEIPSSALSYDEDARMIERILQEHFVNARIIAFAFDDLKDYFTHEYPWFYRFQIQVVGQTFLWDMPFHLWYETKDHKTIIHIAYNVIKETLMNYIVGAGLRL